MLLRHSPTCVADCPRFLFRHVTPDDSGKPMDLEGNHIEYDPNPKIKHNGTLKYTSIDAHAGAYPSRRTDLHILGYVMLNLAGTLPWLADCETVSATNFAGIAAKVEKMKLSFSGTSGAAGTPAAKAKAAATKLVKACCADPCGNFDIVVFGGHISRAFLSSTPPKHTLFAIFYFVPTPIAY